MPCGHSGATAGPVGLAGITSDSGPHGISTNAWTPDAVLQLISETSEK